MTVCLNIKDSLLCQFIKTLTFMELFSGNFAGCNLGNNTLKSSIHTVLKIKQICVYLLLLGCIFSLPSLNRVYSGTEMILSVPVETSSGIPDGEEGTHAAKDLHSSIFSTKSRHNPDRPVKITGPGNENPASGNFYDPVSLVATALVRPSYYAFLFRYNLF
jgi:hypothetical protein